MKTANSSNGGHMRVARDRAAVEHIAEMLNVAQRIGTEGDPIDSYTFDLQAITDQDEALDLYRRTVMHVQAATAVKRAVGERLAQMLGEGGAACYGTNIVRYKQGSTEKCFDPAGAMGALSRMHLEGNIKLDEALFNPDNVKKGGMPSGFRDTFYHKVDDDEPSLETKRVVDSPLFLQDMTDGEWRTQ